MIIHEARGGDGIASSAAYYFLPDRHQSESSDSSIEDYKRQITAACLGAIASTTHFKGHSADHLEDYMGLILHLADPSAATVTNADSAIFRRVVENGRSHYKKARALAVGNAAAQGHLTTGALLNELRLLSTSQLGHGPREKWVTGSGFLAYSPYERPGSELLVPKPKGEITSESLARFQPNIIAQIREVGATHHSRQILVDFSDERPVYKGSQPTFGTVDETGSYKASLVVGY